MSERAIDLSSIVLPDHVLRAPDRSLSAALLPCLVSPRFAARITRRAVVADVRRERGPTFSRARSLARERDAVMRHNPNGLSLRDWKSPSGLRLLVT